MMGNVVRDDKLMKLGNINNQGIKSDNHDSKGQPKEKSEQYKFDIWQFFSSPMTYWNI